ncbi:AraC family transcriptional regulator [Xanthomonas sp. SI]|uniref:AraC family transcriptional regulator n=1 Tax=Xanthomonas sp. SI TaxID=2724123 RepID=UPI00163A9A8F|nr:AraC family transcriptional regulator [Xanthomonas sp. SI]QNH10944.1 transcriptional regulator [Xanthomonas sp. SI]
MPANLLETARRYADANVDEDGVAHTPLPGLAILRETRPTPLHYAICRPLVALVLQGRKQVTMGSSSYDFGAGESLLVTAEVPTVSQITHASLAAPYYACVVELDPATIASLVAEMGTAPFAMGSPLRVDPTEAEVADTADRLIRLLDRPASVHVLGPQLLRELHYWLLSGRHGGAMRALGVTDSHARRVGRAVARIRSDFAKPLRVEQLADAAGMSLSTFHVHFRAITSLTPLQFQKQLRLIEARRLLLAEGATIGWAASAVGYESVPQFTREYGRMFGMPPGKDMKHTRQRLTSAA